MDVFLTLMWSVSILDSARLWWDILRVCALVCVCVCVSVCVHARMFMCVKGSLVNTPFFKLLKGCVNVCVTVCVHTD